MTPTEAMRAVLPPNPKAEDYVRVSRLRELIVSNITKSGTNNLARVARERGRHLPPLKAGDIVLLSSEKPQKLHSASVGMYALLVYTDLIKFGLANLLTRPYIGGLRL